MERGYKRRNYFINQDLQGRMIFAVFLHCLFVVTLFTLVFVLLSAEHLTISYTDQQFRLGATPLVLFKELLQANWVFIICGGGLLSLLMLFVSHAVAGPLYRFEAVFKGLNQRDLNQHIQLRSRDIGHNLETSINQFSSLYSADILRLQELSGLLKNALHTENFLSAQQCQREID